MGHNGRSQVVVVLVLLGWLLAPGILAQGILAHGIVAQGAGRVKVAETPPATRPGTMAPAFDTLTTAQRRAIDAFVAGAMEELDLVPGLAVAVVVDDGIVYQNGFGWAHVERREPVTAETIFYTASLSKALTGMAAAVLADRGRLDLDAPITTWYPGLDFPAPLAPAESTTVRRLLTHTPRFLNSGVNSTRPSSGGTRTRSSCGCSTATASRTTASSTRT